MAPHNSAIQKATQFILIYRAHQNLFDLAILGLYIDMFH